MNSEVETLCRRCARTGGDLYFEEVIKNNGRVPKSLAPCSFITEGIVPKDAKTIIDTPTRCVITECPCYVKDVVKNKKRNKAIYKLSDPKYVCVETGETYKTIDEMIVRENKSQQLLYQYIKSKGALPKKRDLKHYIKIEDISEEHIRINPKLIAIQQAFQTFK